MIRWVAAPATRYQSPRRAHAVLNPQPHEIGGYVTALCGVVVICELAPVTLPWCGRCAELVKRRR